MKALAYEIDGDLHCCVCLEKVVFASEYPNLLCMAAIPEIVDTRNYCPQCDRRYGGKKQELAAGRIADFLTKKEAKE